MSEGDGRPPQTAAEPQSQAAAEPRRGLRDHPLGKLALLLLVLGAALLVARTCGANNQEISQEEAVEIATEAAPFEPCAEPLCVQVRYIPQGIPVRGYWGVVLAPSVNEEGQPTRTAAFLVDIQTGEITRR